MLVERDQELSTLAQLLARLGSNGGKVVLIRGEAGIGKSALIREFVGAVTGTADIHVGFCDDLSTPQPYGPLWDIARSEPELLAALRQHDRRVVLEASLGLVVGKLRPAVVVIEDTHWSDEATLDAVRYLGRRIARCNGLLLLTFRDGEVDHQHPLRRVVSDLPPGSVERIGLGSLSRHAVAQMVEPLGLDAGHVFEITNGNPFLVTEMASTGEDVPSSVRDWVQARVSRLSDAAVSTLQTLSVVPKRLSLSQVMALTGASLESIIDSERAGLLTVEGDVVAFRHELIRRAMEASLTISEGVAIHRALLSRIPSDADPAWLVYHARHGHDLDRLIALAPSAARAAAKVGSNRESVAHFRSLEPHLGRLPPIERAELLRDWAMVEHYLENPRCIEILDEAIALLRQAGRERDLARALISAVVLNREHGRSEIARSYSSEAVALLEAGDPTADLAQALTIHAWQMIHTGVIDQAERDVALAIEVAETTEAEAAMINALGIRGVLGYVRGETSGLELLEQSRERAQRGGYRYLEVESLLQVAVVAVEIRDIDRASDYALRARAAAARSEMTILETTANAVYCEALAWRGDWQEAEDVGSEVVGRHARADVHLEATLGVLKLRSGRPEAEAHIRRGWELAVIGDEMDDLLVAGSAVAEQMWIRRQPDPSLVTELNGVLVRGIRSEYPWPAGSLAGWLWALGCLDEIPPGLPDPYRCLFRGRIEEAANFWRSRRIPYERAITLLYGDTSHRVEALEILESLGASAVARRLRSELRACGVVLTRGKAKTTRANRAGLTARQTEILDLLARGLTNTEISDRLFISRRTVESHVSAVLAKLGVVDRDKAVSIAREEGMILASGAIASVPT